MRLHVDDEVFETPTEADIVRAVAAGARSDDWFPPAGA